MNPQEVDSRYFVEYREYIYLAVLKSYSTPHPPLVPREHDIVVLKEFPASDSIWRVKEVIQYPPNRVVVLVNEWKSSAVNRLARLEEGEK